MNQQYANSRFRLTGGEEDDGFETRVLGRVDVERLEFLDLFLEYANVVHEGDDAVGRHGTGVQAGGGQQRRHVQRHRALRRVQHEQLAPDQPQQRHLVRHLHRRTTTTSAQRPTRSKRPPASRKESTFAMNQRREIQSEKSRTSLRPLEEAGQSRWLVSSKMNYAFFFLSNAMAGGPRDRLDRKSTFLQWRRARK